MIIPVRRAVTLLELVVAILVIAVLIGLTLGAIQRVRTAALQTQSTNNLRQISLGLHSFYSANADKISKLPTSAPNVRSFTGASLFSQILNFTAPNARVPIKEPWTREASDVYNDPYIAVYLSPADPSFAANIGAGPTRRKISYSYNLIPFDGSMTFPFTIQDGTSSTLAFAERYWYTSHSYTINESEHRIHCSIDWDELLAEPGFTAPRRATFADKVLRDVYPVSNGRGQSTGSDLVQYVPLPAGIPFAVRPPVHDSWCDRLQTPHPAGLPVAMFDGSVRTLHPNIAEHVFWGLVTPAGGEVLGDY